MIEHPFYRPSGDPELSLLAKQAKDLPKFPDESDNHKAFFEEYSKSCLPKNVKRCPDNYHEKTVLYIGGKRRTLAFMKMDRTGELARLTDYLVMQLWPFKGNRVGPPIGANFTYPMEWVERDVIGFPESCPELVAWVESVVACLLDRKIISETETPRDRKPRAKRKAILNVLDDKFSALTLQLDRIEALLLNAQATP